jgi:hypothetical protein
VGNAVVLITWLAQFVALFAFLETYIRARGTDRQRILWVVVGFGVSLLAVSVQQFLTIYLTNAPLELDELISSLNICAPLSFAYAIIRYRVIDVNFVVSRALVYGVLTTLLVGIFSIIDWLFTDKLQLARLGTLAQVGAVVAFGVWFNGLHKRVDGFVDATFYRQRHRAEVQLARNAGALPFVTSGRAVAEVLVAEPVRAVGLASAALFRRCRDGSLHREQSIGWSDLEVTVLNEGDDHFIALLLATNGPLSLYDHPWRSQGVPPGPGCPVLALPIIVRRQLAAVVFYGSHPHGEALDPDEIKAIAGLAPGAAAAYDHLEAQTMSEQVSMLQAKVESLESRLAEAQIQPA